MLVVTPTGTGAGRAYAKVRGRLVELPAKAAGPLVSGGVFGTDAMQVAVSPITSARAQPGRLAEADMVFEIREWRVGYGGFYRCSRSGFPSTN